VEQRKTKSLVQEQSFRFAVNLVNYARRQQEDYTIRVLVRQLLRSGTSIGANVEEALGGQSRKDFIAKLAIAAKEARETSYWLRLITNTQSRDSQELTALSHTCDGLIRMLNSIILTTRNMSASDHTSSSRTSRSSENSEPRTHNSEPSVP
jgi:four helix bundle protein